jgi:hypothetical protein
MCCGRKRISAKRSKSGRINRIRKPIEPQVEIHDEKHIENRERLLNLPIDGPDSQKRTVGEIEI